VKSYLPPGAAHLGVIALALLAVACSSSRDDAAQPGGKPIGVKVADFAIEAPKRISAGNVVLRVRNGGPDMHELILVRADGARVPLRPDNLTVDEDAIEQRTVSILEDDHPNTVRDWHLSLKPGRYVLLCNMSGHYLGGMHTQVVVR
jgi:uncharacterized cupredoxin-like copper-binding protein